MFLHNDRPHRSSIVVLYNVDESAVRAALHCAGRNYDHLLERIDQQTNVDELPRPELQIGISELRLQLYGSGGLVDLVVDDLEQDMIDDCVIVRTQRIDRERTKLLVIVVFDAPAHRGKVREIVEAYNSRFGQHGVFRSEQPVCAGL